LSSYNECNWDKAKPAGVCPDSFLAGGANGLNNSQMLHGQQIDGKFCLQACIRTPVIIIRCTKFVQRNCRILLDSASLMFFVCVQHCFFIWCN